MSFTSKTRILYINYLKILGMVYLLFWHTEIKYLNIISISFFIQMFFFVSGYFYKDPAPGFNNYFHFIVKRIKSLYFPFIKYSLTFLLLNRLLVHLHIISEGYRIPVSMTSILNILKLNANQPLAGAMWFVAALFWTALLFLLLSAFLDLAEDLTGMTRSREVIRLILVTGCYFFGYHLTSKQILLPAHLDISFTMLIFYYLGFIYRKYEGRLRNNFLLAAICLAILIYLSRIGFPAIASRQYTSPSHLLLCGIAGTYFTFYLSVCAARITPDRLAGWINYMGENTMAILALHFLAFKLIHLIYIFSYNLPIQKLSAFPTIPESSQLWRWGYVLAGFFLPLLGTLAVKKAKPVLQDVKIFIQCRG